MNDMPFKVSQSPWSHGRRMGERETHAFHGITGQVPDGETCPGAVGAQKREPGVREHHE